MKKLIKKLIGRNRIDRVKYLRDRLRLAIIRSRNRLLGISFVNLGAGTDAEKSGWWAGDVQTGFVIDEHTKLPFGDESVRFAYSSMFFEHITDATAKNLLTEIRRILKPGACFRVVVPDFHLYIRKYHEKDRDFFYSPENQNFATWQIKNVPLDMEHLLVAMISSLQNLPHDMVPYPFLEDFSTFPPRVCYPFQLRYEGYYCGPAPELTTERIVEGLVSSDESGFLDWVFAETMVSSHQDKTFNFWHKNHWNLEKLTSFARAADFSKIEASAFGASPVKLSEKIEKPGHARLGLYFNLCK